MTLLQVLVRSTTASSLLMLFLGLTGCKAPSYAASKMDDGTSIQHAVQHFDSVKEIKYPWGWIRWMMNAELDPGAAQTVGIVQIDPHQHNPRHKHPNCEEVLYVISGSLDNVVGDKTVVLHAGDILRIPAGVPHQGINNTDQVMRAFISYSSGTRQMVQLDKDQK